MKTEQIKHGFQGEVNTMNEIGYFKFLTKRGHLWGIEKGTKDLVGCRVIAKNETNTFEGSKIYYEEISKEEFLLLGQQINKNNKEFLGVN